MTNKYFKSVAQLFSQIALDYKNRTALKLKADSFISYNELNTQANIIADILINEGLKKGDRICLILDKSPFAYEILIAALKIGAPYFFIDPANPKIRIKYMLKKCEPKLIIYSCDLNEIDFECKKIYINNLIEKINFYKIDNKAKEVLDHTITGSDPAYIMFTSGSTGFPKGVVISHQNILNFIFWSKEQFNITPDDIFSNVNLLSFDNSVFDIYSSIFTGASLVPVSTDEMKNPYNIIQKIEDCKCTIYFSVPSLLIYFQTLKILNKNSMQSVKKIIFGGEGYPKVKLKELYDILKKRVKFYNVYGPTECTCICSIYEISDEDFDDMLGYPALGSLIPNFSYLIVDNEKIVENDTNGELWLKGPNVGLGYYNDTEQNEKSFIQNPFDESYFERVYKTGDIVKYNSSDKKIYFVGRKDNQIKHQGYRIELAEIEHALNRISGIDEAVALHTTKNGFSSIVGLVSSRKNISKDYIKSELAKYIPKYMIPNSIEIYEFLPKNANGKIDRILLKNKYC